MQIGESAIRDTVAAVFRAPEFNRVHAPPLFVRIVWWILDRVRELRAVTAASPALYYALLGVTALVVAALVGRAIYLAYLVHTGEAALTGRRRAARGAAGADPWLLAQQCAAAGDFTAAAHHLYAGVLQAVARRQLVRLHPSKTIGDYVRELRSRASTALLAPFREFARAYEAVIYGAGHCDRNRYERLRALAAAIVARDG
jgi:hypothetical protein